MKLENYSEKTLISLRKLLVQDDKELRKSGRKTFGCVASRSISFELTDDIIAIDKELNLRKETK